MSQGTILAGEGEKVRFMTDELADMIVSFRRKLAEGITDELVVDSLTMSFAREVYKEWAKKAAHPPLMHTPPLGSRIAPYDLR